MHAQRILIKGILWIWSFVCVNEQNVQPCYWNIAIDVNVLHESLRSGLRFSSGSLPETLNKQRRLPGTAAREPNINSGSGCPNTRLDAEKLPGFRPGNGTYSCSRQSGQSAVLHLLSGADYLCQSFMSFFTSFTRVSSFLFFFFFIRQSAVWLLAISQLWRFLGNVDECVRCVQFGVWN